MRRDSTTIHPTRIVSTHHLSLHYVWFTTEPQHIPDDDVWEQEACDAALLISIRPNVPPPNIPDDTF